MQLELQLVPNKAPAIQLYARVSGAPVGSPIAGVVDVTYSYLYRFDIGSNSGDYDVQLSGVSVPNAGRFPVRKGIAYPGLPWSIIDATIAVPPVLPSAITGLCHVLVAATFNGNPIVGASVHCTLDGRNNTVDGILVSRAVESGVTNASGNCILTLIRFGQFTRGGIYSLRVSDAGGKILHDRRVTIPNASTANAEDLPDAAQ